MKLKFKAVEGCMVYLPGSVQTVGQAARYIGRILRDGVYIVGDPLEIEDGAPEVTRLCKLARRGDIEPADKATAEFCGLKFSQKADK